MASIAPVCSPTPIICDHAGKDLGFTQWLGERLAFFEGLANLQQRFFHDSISCRLGGDVQAFKNGDAAGDERAKRTREAGYRNFPEQKPDQRGLQKSCVYNVASLGRSIPHLNRKDGSHRSHKKGQSEITSDEATHANYDSCRR